MCGILAVLGVADVSLAKRARIIELSRRLRHRGPDWSGLHCHQDCYLAHQRLAIVDPTSGDQPLYNEDKSIVVTVNGEIYNHVELKAKLTTHQFQTGSDCEVIAHLYEEYGEEFVDMLDGMFAFVLLDTRDKTFIAARDAIGICPLYMGWGLDGMYLEYFIQFLSFAEIQGCECLSISNLSSEICQSLVLLYYCCRSQSVVEDQGPNSWLKPASYCKELEKPHRTFYSNLNFECSSHSK